MFSNLGPLICAEFGILPIGAFLALSREGTDDSTPDELKQFRERARNVAEAWGWKPAIQQAEDQQRDQDDVEKD